MKAVMLESFDGPEALVVRELADPEPGPMDVLIEVAAAGVNFPDLMVVDGTYQILPEVPFSPGKEIAGRIAAVGAEVSEFEVGQRVLAQVEYGGYRELVCTDQSLVVPIPDEIGYPTAAAFGLGYITAHFALVHRAALQPGETVVVTGAGGGVGSAGVQLAKALGARVIAVAQDDERADLARQQGAHVVVIADEQLREHLREITDGHGADVVLETVGGSVFDACQRATAWEGRLVAIGFASGEIPTLKVGRLLVKNMTLIGLQVSDYRDKQPRLVREAIESMLDLFVAGHLDVPVSATYPLKQAADALRDLRSGEVKGKIVLETGRCRD